MGSADGESIKIISHGTKVLTSLERQLSTEWCLRWSKAHKFSSAWVLHQPQVGVKI